MLNCHQHSEFSKDALSKVDAIADAHLEIGTKSFCITDHGTMSSFPTAFKVAKEKGMKFVPGIEIYLVPPEKYDSKFLGIELKKNLDIAKLKKIDPEIKAQAKARVEEIQNTDGRRNFHMTLLAKSQEGLHNLFKIYTEGELYYTHRVFTESLIKHKKDVIVLSGCLGSELCYYVKTRKIDEAEALVQRYKKEFGENYYIEIMHHGVIDDKEQSKGYMGEKEIYDTLIHLARKYGVKIIATNDGHYTCAEEAGLHSLYTKMIYNKKKAKEDEDASETKGDHGTGYFVASEEELSKRLIDNGYKEEDVKEMMESVREIEASVEDGIDIQSPPSLIRMDQELMDKLMKSWERMRKGTEYELESLDRIKHEMNIIAEKNFSEYFINMDIIVQRAYDIGLLTGPGRGSAAGCEIAYLLGIHNTDPLKYGLIFERFLNPSRSTMPDIDLDIMSKKAGDHRLGSEILTDSLKDVFEFSGRINNVVRASTLTLFKQLSSYYRMNTQMVNKFTTSSLGKEMLAKKDTPSYKEFRDTVGNVIGFYDPNWDEVYRRLSMCYKLDKIAGGTSVHASGVIMTKKYIPLPVDSNGVIDFNGKSLESYNYLKYDLLSVENIDAIEYIYGLDIDWEDVYDEKVYDTICRGELDFVFQLSGPVPRRMILDGGARSIEDLADISAINRPGPLNMGLNKKWVDIRNGVYEPTPIERTIAGILKKAFGEKHSGLLIYQEDVMRLFVEAANFTLAESESVRRAMGKKDMELMHSFKQKFVENWVSNGYEEDPEEVWGIIEEFSKYAFNKSHAVSYSLISYKNAEMWTYHKEKYLEWIMNNLPKQRRHALAVAKDLNYRVEFPSYKSARKTDDFILEDGVIYPPVPVSMNFETASDFLFSGMSKVDKSAMILAGSLDDLSLDRQGLINLIKAVPDKNIVNYAFPSTNHLDSILDNGALLGLWTFEVLNDRILVKVKKPRSIAEVEIFFNNRIPNKTIETMVKHDITKYGFPKGKLLDNTPVLDTNKIFTEFFILKDRIADMEKGKFDESRIARAKDDLKKEFRKCLNNPIMDKINRLLKDSTFKGFVLSADYKKDYGYMVLKIVFDNEERIFYVRNKRLINELQSLSKNQVAKFKLETEAYISKLGIPIMHYKITGVEM